MSKTTPLDAAHRRLNARMVDFAGWQMPVQYTSVIQEHEAVRTKAGLFDVSHMGEVEFVGPGALTTVNRLITNDLSKCADGQAVYAGLLNERGGFVDDVVAYRFSNEHIFICVNAGNRDKDFAWMTERALGVKPRNRSDDYGQLAIQGPLAAQIVQRMTKTALDTIGTYRFAQGAVGGIECIISRTGYTGEDGFELYCNSAQSERLWNALLDEGSKEGLQACGLGARDSLRTEMKYALYGNDIDDVHTPLEAGLGWIVKLDKGDFIGSEALKKQKLDGVPRKLVGFELVDAGIPRPHYTIHVDGKKVGEVTSGTMGPSVKKPIGIGYVATEFSKEGQTLEVDIRGRMAKAVVVKTPFYTRPK